MSRVHLAAIFGTLFALAKPVWAASAKPPLYAEAFSRAFEPGWSAEVNDALDGEEARPVKVSFRMTTLGALKIVSGQICAADPFVGMGAKPYVQAVPNGAFPVQLAVLQGTMGEGRVAFARVAFSEKPVAQWRLAVTEGDDPAKLSPGEAFGYPVDTGLGSFFDPAAGRAAQDSMNEGPDVADRWLEEGKRCGQSERGGSAFRLLTDAGQANIAAFDTGWGDGVYASWFGFDPDGNVAVLLTDFQALDWDRVTF